MTSPHEARPLRPATYPTQGAWLRRIFGGSLLMAALSAVGQALPFAAAPPGIVESGVPAFVVLGAEALGLSAPPTDLQILPDGRILAIARDELALGDGLRWEVYRQADGDERNDTVSVAVDPQGSIYAGVRGGFARIEFEADAHWRLRSVAAIPVEILQGPTCTTAAMSSTDWFWHSGSGGVFAWQPGAVPRLVGNANNIIHVFSLGADTFISNGSDGATFRVRGSNTTPVVPPGQITANSTVTCSTPFAPGQLLLGTRADGLKLFDGESLRPFTSRGLMASALRVSDLCATGDGLFAAAIDNTGLIFFDREGNVVQVLDRALDHRLARVKHLLYRSGVLWALLNDGIARVRFPSRLSHFDPLATTGLAHVQPFRYDGRLWLLADGITQRGVYNADGRLLHFENDTPPGTFVHTLSDVMGPLLATNEEGIFRRRDDHWELALPGLAYARVDIPSADARRWFYVARGELGWLRHAGDTIAAERHPQPGLDQVYAMIHDSAGRIWLELGSRSIGLVDASGEVPQLRILGPEHGVPDGWVNAFLLDGQARFNIANRLFRFDDATQRVIEDAELVRRYPLLASTHGRPARDARGRLWVTARGMVHVLEDSPSGPRTAESVATGLLPFLFTMEKGGVVWLFASRHLARFDPDLPEPAPAPLHVLITRVHLTASDRSIFAFDAELPALTADDNSLVVHFLAPGNPFGTPVTFDVRMEGAGSDWVSTGGTGSAAFNRLKEGRYTLQVRPRAGAVIGEHAELSFTVRPPWFRTPLAYALYGVGAISLILGIAWWASFLERREKARLEVVVTQRTHELKETNLRLAQQVDETVEKAKALQASEERYRHLSEDLERRVQDRTAALTESNHELESFSYSVSHDLRAPLRNISGFADLLRKRLQPVLDAESTRFLGIVATESVRLGQLIDSLLTFSRLGRTDLKRRRFPLAKLIEEACGEFTAELAQRPIEFHIGALPDVLADPTLLRQVLVNLLGNAVKFTRTRTPAIIEIGLVADGPVANHTAPTARAVTGEQVFYVRDNGAGFDPQYSDKLFGVFQRLHHARDFEGTGIGLANVKRIISRHGGRVWAEGIPGQGATFYFTLPA